MLQPVRMLKHTLANTPLAQLPQSVIAQVKTMDQHPLLIGSLHHYDEIIDRWYQWCIWSTTHPWSRPCAIIRLASLDHLLDSNSIRMQ